MMSIYYDVHLSKFHEKRSNIALLLAIAVFVPSAYCTVAILVDAHCCTVFALIVENIKPKTRNGLNLLPVCRNRMN